jgi:alpha-tubulin suppressor-like RCC1 family protein
MKRLSALLLALPLFLACSREKTQSPYGQTYSGHLALAELDLELGYTLQWNESADGFLAGTYGDGTLSAEAPVQGRVSAPDKRVLEVSFPNRTSGVTSLRFLAEGTPGDRLRVTLTALGFAGDTLATAKGRAFPGEGNDVATPEISLEGRFACVAHVTAGPPAVTSFPATAVILPDGGLRVWGSNDGKALGLGAVGPQLAPTGLLLPGAGAVTWVALGTKFGAAVDASGKLFYWGHFVYPFGAIGADADPTEITGLAFTPKKVYAGQNALYVIDAEKRVWAVGEDLYGQQGNAAASTDNANFTEIPGGAGADSLVTWGYSATVFALKGGELWSFGESTNNKHGGSLGAGPYVPVETPARVLSAFSDVVHVSQDAKTAMAIRENGEVYTFGSLGDALLKGGRDSSGSTEAAAVDGGATFTAFTGGVGLGTLVRDVFGDVYAFGANAFGLFGVGAAASETGQAPALVADFPEVSALKNCGSATFAVKPDGTLWAAGRQEMGQLGNDQDVPADATAFVPVPGIDFTP